VKGRIRIRVKVISRIRTRIRKWKVESGSASASKWPPGSGFRILIKVTRIRNTAQKGWNNSVADRGCLYRIPDPNFSHPRSRICIKEFKYFNPKKWFLSSRKYDLGWSSWIRILIFLPIPVLAVKKAPDPGSGSATLWNNMDQVIILLFRRDLQAARARGEIPGQLQAQRGLSQAPRRIGSSQGNICTLSMRQKNQKPPKSGVKWDKTTFFGSVPKSRTVHRWVHLV
jgi:hypothetical protein